MKRAGWIIGVAALVTAMVAGEASAQVPLRPASTANNDPIALGEPLSHWLSVIRSHDSEELEMAFDAIVQLGPAAWRAVPELTHIVAAPFTPIQIGKDDHAEILAKLVDIHRRAGAVDSLGAIGTAAAPAADPVIQWALTLRVLPPEVRTPNDAFYIELVGMDVLERMRGAAATAQFGVRAADAVQGLIESRDDEKIKFASAVLSEGSLPIAADLMTSESCRDRTLGLKLLAGMWPVVAIDHLRALKEIAACPTEDSTNNPAVDSLRAGSKKLRTVLN